MSREIQKLAVLADMIRDAELNRLRVLAQHRQGIEADLARTRLAQVAARAQAAPDPAHLSGSDRHWQTWSDRRLRDLSMQAAQSAAETEAQMLAARRAFGRARALGHLGVQGPRKP